MIGEVLSMKCVGKESKWMECIKYGIFCFVFSLVAGSILLVAIGSNVALPMLAIDFVIAWWIAKEFFSKKSRLAAYIAVGALVINLAIVGLLILLFGVALFAAFMT